MKEFNDTGERVKIIWLRASILGGIWASSEIILGSFLHNLRIPLSGMILSAISVFLITAFDKQWRQNGIVWRAGLIAALMKSISPSAVIFGPMIGIFCEAVVYQLIVNILGRSVISYSVAGALAVSCSFFQMVINLIIVYGSNIILLYSNVYKYVFKTLSIKNADPSTLIILFLCIYFLIGATAAIIGFKVKKNASTQLYDFTQEAEFNYSGRQVFTNHSLLFLTLVIVLMVVGISYINTLSFYFSFSFMMAFVSACYYRYRAMLKRIIKVRFWLEMMIIALLSSFFLSKFQNNTFFSLNGLFAGYLMVYRAVILSVSFNILSIELANPKVKRFFSSKKLSNVSEALETSFKTLPILISLLTTNKDKVKRPLILVAEYINSANNWIDYKLQNRIS